MAYLRTPTPRDIAGAPRDIEPRDTAPRETEPRETELRDVNPPPRGTARAPKEGAAARGVEKLRGTMAGRCEGMARVAIRGGRL